ncbi:hypothetical protein ON010_g9261 [Phytophthora cinnamomi]|nr:hypothetical protein ON010_g9261 [Phytophthora cinnamomi]
MGSEAGPTHQAPVARNLTPEIVQASPPPQQVLLNVGAPSAPAIVQVAGEQRGGEARRSWTGAMSEEGGVL